MLKLLKKPEIAAFILTMSVLHAAQIHALTLAETPLFLSAGADPNILFLLDDSGSMQYEVMPESLTIGGNRFVFPRTDNVYGGYEFGISSSGVALPGHYTSLTGYNLGRVVRSPAHNKIYYNPAIRYEPWVHPQGGFFPNASPTCALHNPMRPLPTGQTFDERYCRNLIENDDRTFGGQSSTWVRCASLTASCGTSNSDSVTYWPATYWRYTSASYDAADIFNAANYQQVTIRSSTPTYTGDGRQLGKRTDCEYDANGVFLHCTYTQEIQNFANWYTYYRSRLLTAHAGIGRAFAKQGEGIRVGFGAINKGGALGLPTSEVDGESDTRVVIRGVRQFTAAEKQNFLQTLYTHPLALWTPLRGALYHAGKYFERSDNSGPWGANPGTDDETPHLSCRRSNTILMTDGFWTDGDVFESVGNADGTSGSVITNHNPDGSPTTYTYSPTSPFMDNVANATISNTLADVAMHYWKRDLRTDLPNRVKNNDMNPAFWQHMTTFGVGLGVSGTVTHIDNSNFSQVITNQEAITWNNPTTDPRKLDDLLHASLNGRGGFFSAQDPESFSEELSKMLQDITSRENNNAAAAAANSTNLTENSVIYQALFSTVDWSGKIRAISVAGAGSLGNTLWESSVGAPAERNIYTYNDDSREGVAFDWNNISVNQKALLQGDNSADLAQARFNWLRGIEHDDLRARDGRLVGDIVNSDPEYAGNRNSRYDRLSDALGGNTYFDYYNEQKVNRPEVLYVGANDGMMHAFDVTTGEEIFAYAPSLVYGKLRDLSMLDYGKQTPHRYTVDGPIYVGDAYINNSWRSILVGSLGAGGRGIYVLDVTDPSNFGPDDVLFELSEANYPQLGHVFGNAVVAPGKDNRWKIYLGNGVNSTSGQSFLGVIDIEDEVNKAVVSRTRFIPTNAMTENGLSEPALLPDSDGTVRAAYAGDLQGNLWKFDLSSPISASWSIAYGAPLFVAQRDNDRQAITVVPTLGLNTEVSPTAVMVYFGTGRYMADVDRSSSNIQSFYAIADKNTNIPVNNRSSLHAKTIAATSTETKRIIEGQVEYQEGIPVNAVDWSSVDGWYLDFVTGERVIARAQLRYDRLVFPTIIPGDDPCGAGGTGWFMELIGVGSGDLEFSIFGTHANNKLETPIFGGVSLLEGNVSNGSDPLPPPPPPPPPSSSSSSSEDCVGTEIAGAGSAADGSAVNIAGKGRCDPLGRQSWRELR